MTILSYVDDTRGEIELHDCVFACNNGHIFTVDEIVISSPIEAAVISCRVCGEKGKVQLLLSIVQEGENDGNVPSKHENFSEGCERF